MKGKKIVNKEEITTTTTKVEDPFVAYNNNKDNNDKDTNLKVDKEEDPFSLGSKFKSDAFTIGSEFEKDKSKIFFF